MSSSRKPTTTKTSATVVASAVSAFSAPVNLGLSLFMNLFAPKKAVTTQADSSGKRDIELTTKNNP